MKVAKLVKVHPQLLKKTEFYSPILTYVTLFSNYLIYMHPVENMSGFAPGCRLG